MRRQWQRFSSSSGWQTNVFDHTSLEGLCKGEQDWSYRWCRAQNHTLLFRLMNSATGMCLHLPKELWSVFCALLFFCPSLWQIYLGKCQLRQGAIYQHPASTGAWTVAALWCNNPNKNMVIYICVHSHTLVYIYIQKCTVCNYNIRLYVVVK